MSPCPYCGSDAVVPEGTYSVLSRTVKALRSPGLTREKIEKFRAVVEEVKERRLDESEAADRVDALNSSLAVFWKWANENGQALQLIVAIIGLFLLIYYQQGSEEQAAQQHEDAQQQLRVERLIYEELQRRGEIDSTPVAPPSPMRETRIASQGQMTAKGPNRHERRKAAAEGRRKGQKSGD